MLGSRSRACPQCGRRVRRRDAVCGYCGALTTSSRRELWAFALKVIVGLALGWFLYATIQGLGPTLGMHAQR